MSFIRPEQDKKAHARADEQARHHLPRAEHAGQIQLRNHNRSGAVRDQPDQSGQNNADHRTICKEARNCLLAEAFDQNSQHQTDQKDKHNNMQRMNKCCFQDAALFAVLAAAVFVFTEVTDVFFGLVPVLREPESEINRHARHRADDRLCQKDL